MGAHPGIPIFFFMVMMGFLAGGADGSPIKALAGAGVMVLVIGPLLAIGANERAQTSDRLQETSE